VIGFADTEWRIRGACNGMDTELFFPNDADPIDPTVLAACARCTVRGVCLDWALRFNEPGVWGGTTDFERRQLVARKTRVKCPGCQSRNVMAVDGGEICASCGLTWLT